MLKLVLSLNELVIVILLFLILLLSIEVFILKRKINTFWLGRLQLEIVDSWNEVVTFVLNIKKNIQFYLER